MKKILLPVIVTISLCTACTDGLLYDNSSYHSSDIAHTPRLKFCNEEPRLIVDHTVSEDGLEYVQSFIDGGNLSFVPLGTNKENLKTGDIWTWTKTAQNLNKERWFRDEIPCENSDLQEQIYSIQRAAEIEYYDGKNGLSFRIDIKGVFSSDGLIPNGIKGEVLEMTIKPDNSTRRSHIINYLTNDTAYYKYPCSEPSSLIPELTLKQKTITNFITTEIPGDHDKYKVFLKKHEGIVLLQEIATGDYWEPLNNDN